MYVKLLQITFKLQEQICVQSSVSYVHSCTLKQYQSMVISPHKQYYTHVCKPDVQSLVKVFIVFLSRTMHVLCLFRDSFFLIKINLFIRTYSTLHQLQQTLPELVLLLILVHLLLSILQ